MFEQGDIVSVDFPFSESSVRIHKIFLLNESLIIRKVTVVKNSFLTKVISRIAEIIEQQ